ncbi:hypothetical protein Ac2012v2_004588 [Leucoagaricus gongylophorus]
MSHLIMARQMLRYQGPFSSQSPPVFQRTHMATMQIKKEFLSSPNFAIVGASKDQSKFGTKILKWYQTQKLNVIPVHPREAELEGIATVPALKELPSPSTTSVSLDLLKEAKELDIPALWLQPGAEDEAVTSFIKENGLEDRIIYGGSCLLVEGEGIRRSLL